MELVRGARALVTGAGSGIGRATALRLAAEGASVAICDVVAQRAEQVAEEIRKSGKTAVAIQADVRDDEAVKNMVVAAADALGGLTILVNNAGTSTLSPLADLIEEEWDLVIDVCLKGAYLGIRHAVPQLLAAGGGHVVNVASISGIVPSAGEAHYAAAKAGISALTKSAAIELGPDITVNAVAPGTIHTALTEPQLGMQRERERILSLTPAGRIGQPADVADVILFLASPLARFVTGHTLVVDGGLSLRGSGVGTALETVRELGVLSPLARDVGTTPGATFGSLDWLEDVRTRAAADHAFADAAADADVSLSFAASGPDGERRSFCMDVRNGRIADVTDAEGPGDVRLSAPLDVWRRIFTGDLDATKAFTMRMLEVDGDMDKLTAAIPALLRLFDLLVEAPPSFGV